MFLNLTQLKGNEKTDFLNISLTKRIVEELGGKVKVYSQENMGFQFLINLKTRFKPTTTNFIRSETDEVSKSESKINDGSNLVPNSNRLEKRNSSTMVKSIRDTFVFIEQINGIMLNKVALHRH